MAAANPKVTTDSDEYPVTLDELKDLIRANDADDGELTPLLASATTQLEDSLGRSFITKTWTWYRDSFVYHGRGPLDDFWYNPVGHASRNMDVAIELPRAPLTGITSIKYVDTGGTLQTWDSSNYQVDTSRDPGRVMPVSGTVWPTPANPSDYFNPVRIEFTAGYGAAADAVPYEIRHAIAMLVGHYYEHREATVFLPLNEVNPGLWEKIQNYKVTWFR